MEGTINSYIFRSQQLEMTLGSSISLSPDTWGEEDRLCKCACFVLLASHSLSRWLTYFSATVPLSKKLLWPSDASSKFHKDSGDQSPSTARQYRQCTVCLPLTSTPALCACLSPFSSTYIALTGSRRITDVQHSVEGSQIGPAHQGGYNTYRCNMKFLAETVINYNTTLLNV